MNVFNRVVVVFSLLCAIAVLAVAVVMPGPSVAWLKFFAEGADALLTLPGMYIHWAVTAVLLLVAVILLVLEMRRPRRLTVQVRQAGGGVVELGTESVGRSLEYHIGQIPGVTHVAPQVISRGKSILVALDLELDPLADLPAKSEEVIQLTKELVESKLGLRLAPGSLRLTVRQGAFAPLEPGAAPQVPATPAAPGNDLPMEQTF